jgi:F1F0 ATPase subunit 2
MIDFETVDIGALAIALFWGAVLSGIYFGALWLTLRRLTHSQRHVVLLMMSLLVRLALLLTGFYLILDGGHWDRLLAAVIGFILLRTLLIHKLRPPANARVTPSHTEASS